ncbi:hypothetical protein ABBQ38_005660 [Trebouxia sp. C0009 RCD-2024]
MAMRLAHDALRPLRAPAFPNCDNLDGLRKSCWLSRSTSFLGLGVICLLQELSTELLALKQAFQELVDDYNRCSTAPRGSHFVCNYSSNNLTLDHISHFATWLEGSSIRIYALDFSFNRIFSASWEPVLEVIESLSKHVQYLQVGGNYLPTLTETARLSKLQASGCVSLALPITGRPVNQWQKKWDDIALEFGSKAYDPDIPQYGWNALSAYDQHSPWW